MKYRIREQNELKPSGVEWLGDIPKDWSVKKIKHLFKLIKEKSYEINPIVFSLTQKGLKVRDVTNNEGQLAKTYEGYIQLRKNDFVLNPMDLISGYIDKAEFEGVISPAYISFNKKENSKMNLDYYKYYFQMHYHHKYLFPFGEGVSIQHRWTLKNEIFLNLSIFYCNEIEQQKIAHFLDEKSKIFDDAISKKEQLIAKLELAKQALISEVVTGKLKVVESNAKLHTIKREPSELKPSGVEWLGDIPKEWQVKKLGYIFSFKNGVNTDASNYGRGIKFINVKETINTDFIMGKDIEGSVTISDSIIKENLVKKGDVLFNRTSETIEELALSTVYYDDKIAVFGGFVIRGRQISKDLDLEFKRYCFQSTEIRKQIISYGSGSIRKNIAQTNLKNIYLFVPNLTEQQKISKYLDEKLVHFDNTIAKTKQSITKLKEAKEALISEAVTGKIEVIEKESKANEYFQRRVLAAYFIDKSQNDIYFGRVKLQKMLYMAEAINNLDFKSDYRRHAMGPHDSKMIHSIESQLQKAKWFEARKIKNGNFEKVEYLALENHAEYLKYLDGRYWKQENIDYIFNLMKGMLTLQAEIVATVYSAYIDLSKENRVSQENLLDEILNHWHDNKKKIPKENWLKAIEWMCEKRLIEL